MYNKIVTYVSRPNFINTSKPHAGIMYLLPITKLKLKFDDEKDDDENWLLVPFKSLFSGTIGWILSLAFKWKDTV